MNAGVKRSVDVLVVGSGPVGSAFARAVHEHRPETRILMVDAGPRLTERPGMHVKNLADPAARALAQRRSQGLEQASATSAPVVAPGPPEPGKPRAGTTYADPGSDAFPEGAQSTNVGGMGAHWTCACPRPGDGERVPFLAEGVLDDALAVAERYLAVRDDVFPLSPAGDAILGGLRAAYDAALPAGRRVAPMPLACARATDGTPWWTGSDVVLGPLAEPEVPTFELRDETVCRRLVVERGTVRAAELVHLPTGEREQVEPGAVFVAADALRTPQLLWASGIRPPALGRYLNDHSQVVAAVRLDSRLARASGLTGGTGRGPDPIVGVFWVPYTAHHPFHGQVMHLDMSPIGIVDPSEEEHVVGLGWFVPKELRAEDRVEFDDAELDAYGMARIRVHYGLTARDRAALEAGAADQLRGAAALGELVPGRGPTVVPAGSSLHYQGTTRMGQVDDGTSVCDTSSRVWGHENLLVGGNGVIPTPTATNPTLTSVALAILAARAVA